MKPEVLIVGPMYPSTIEALDRHFITLKLWLAASRAALLASCAERVRGIATTAFPQDGADAALIAALPRLEIISSFGVGVDPIDLDAARARNIIVTNTPAVMNDCVADLAIGLIIAAARRLAYGDRYVRSGGWLKSPLSPAIKVSGKRLGILGLGRIGSAIAKRAAGFDMSIGYCNRHPIAGSPFVYYSKAAELARNSDFFVIATPGGKQTHHLVDEGVLRALGPSGILVNVARGSVVDERALVACLAAGALGGAALDVFENEPGVPEALLAMDNVVLEPHVGSGTHETRAAMGRLVVENLITHFAGRPPLTRVV